MTRRAHEETIDDLVWYVTEKGEQILPKDELKAYSFGHDFGWTSPAAQIAIGWDYDSRVYVVDEFYKAKATDEERFESALLFKSKYG